MDKRIDGWKDILGEVSGDVDGSSGAELWETIDSQEVGAVGNEKTTTDSLELWHGDVAELAVTDESDITTNLGQVWCHDGAHVGAVDTEGGVDRLEGWNAELGDVANGHVVCPLKVWERKLEVWSVVVDDQSGGDVTNLSGDGAEESIVGDLEESDLVEVDAVEGGESSIGDEDAVSLAQWSREGELLKSVEGSPLNGTDLLEDWHDQGRHDGQLGEAHGTSDGGQGVGTKGWEADGLDGDQVTVELLDTIKVDGLDDILADNNVTGEGRARSKSQGVGLVLNGVGLALAWGADLWEGAALGCCEKDS